MRGGKWTSVAAGTILVGGIVVAAWQQQPVPSRARLDGEVVDASTGQSPTDARVEIRRGDGEPSTAGTASPDGHFDVELRQDGRLLVVSAPGYATERRAIDPAATPIRVELVRAASVSGIVFAVTGELIERAVIGARQATAWNHIKSTVRTSDSTFTIGDLHPGRVTLIARAEGFAPSVLQPSVEPGQDLTGVRFALKQAGTIRGRVVSVSDQPMTNVRLRVQYRGIPDAERTLLESFVGGRLVTGTDGAFKLTQLVPDVVFTVEAVGGANRTASPQRRLAPGEQQGILTLRMP